MVEHQSAPSVRNFAREDPADPILVAKLQQAVNLANQNCDRATALAHKLSGQLRDAQDRINQLELEADGLVDRLHGEAQTAVAKLQSDADARVDQTKREADERIAGLEAEAENRINRLQGELAQAKQLADLVKSEADARIERTKAEADERVASAAAETRDRSGRLEDELAQAKQRADHAEQWLVLIRREIEERFVSSFAAVHDRLTPPETD